MKWATNFDKCTVCGSIEKPHKARGMCTSCYGRYINRKLGESQEFTCINCGKVFIPDWYSSIPRKFCCQACERAYRIGKPRGKHLTKEEVIAIMRTAIVSAGKYLSMSELCKQAHICYETLTKLGISRVEVYKDIDVGQPRSLEDSAYYILSEYIPDLSLNKVFDDCYSPKHKKLRFDLYSEALNLLIEIDGEHHRNNTTQEYLQYFQQCDSMKENYAVSKGITFVRVPIKRRQAVSKELIFAYLPESIVRTISSQASS